MSYRREMMCLVASGLLVFGCGNVSPMKDVQGECGNSYGGNVCTWATMNGADLTQAGATIPIASIEGAPKEEAAMAWPPVPSAVLNLPADATKGSGMTHLTTYWEAMGHPPAPFMTPHFDFHFYVITPAEREAIDCSDTAKPTTLAEGYVLRDEPVPPEMVKAMGTSVLVGVCVPKMGMHSLPAADMAGTTAFRGNIVIGYYHAKPIFIEPMISRAMLLEKKSFTLPIPEIPGLAGPYPRSFRADYDAATQAYKFAFSSFGPASPK